MKLKLNCIFLFLLVCSITSSFAQSGVQPGSFGYYQDAIRYSQTNFSGASARIQGLAGAQTALGADISSLYGNPAGIGMYNRFDFNITPSLTFRTAGTSYLDNEKDRFSIDAAINNAGMVIPFTKDDIVPGDWRGGVFGLSLGRTYSFQEQFSYEGRNASNSMIDYFVQRSNGIPRKTIEDEVDKNGNPTSLESLAYYTYLIDPNKDNITYSNLILGVPVSQRETVKRSGTSKQLNMVFAGNYKDRLYIGGNLAFSFLKYKQQRTYEEVMLTPNTFKMLSFLLDDQLETKGTGMNLSVGVLYRFVDWFRLGISFQTPTYYFTVSEVYNTSLTSHFDNFKLSTGDYLTQVNAKMPSGSFSYQLLTPFKASVGMAFFMNKNGFISADVDYVNYASALLQTKDASGTLYSLDKDNETIRSIYKPTFNIRIGGEYRWDIFRFRAGYGFSGDPHRSDFDDLDRSIHTMTCGAGVRFDSYYFDLAIVQNRYKVGYSPYVLKAGNSPSSLSRIVETNLLFTWGFFF